MEGLQVLSGRRSRTKNKERDCKHTWEHTIKKVAFSPVHPSGHQDMGFKNYHFPQHDSPFENEEKFHSYQYVDSLHKIASNGKSESEK
jgi:hypothetical protein